MTAVDGLASAWRIYDRAWEADGTVEVGLPVRVVEQLLRDSGWVRLRGFREADPAWRAPTGELFSETDDAVWFALTAEYAEASTAPE